MDVKVKFKLECDNNLIVDTEASIDNIEPWNMKNPYDMVERLLYIITHLPEEKEQSIADCRKRFADAFSQDSHFRYSYQANIAMCIRDNLSNKFNIRVSKERCNILANEIIKIIFEK